MHQRTITYGPARDGAAPGTAGAPGACLGWRRTWRWNLLPAGPYDEGEIVVRGAGTVLNVATVLLGSGVGVLLRGRLPDRTRTTVTDALGLVTLVIGGLGVAGGLGDPALRDRRRAGRRPARRARRPAGRRDRRQPAAARAAAGGQRCAGCSAGWSGGGGEGRARFVEGYVTASLVFCVGPLTVLGSLSDGLGRGIDQLALKSTLDGFAALAFAASLGWGVAASALSVGVVQGALTVLGALARRPAAARRWSRP